MAGDDRRFSGFCSVGLETKSLPLLLEEAKDDDEEEEEENALLLLLLFAEYDGCSLRNIAICWELRLFRLLMHFHKK